MPDATPVSATADDDRDRARSHKALRWGPTPHVGTGGYLAGACALQARARGPIPRPLTGRVPKPAVPAHAL